MPVMHQARLTSVQPPGPVPAAGLLCLVTSTEVSVPDAGTRVQVDSIGKMHLESNGSEYFIGIDTVANYVTLGLATRPERDALAVVLAELSEAPLYDEADNRVSTAPAGRSRR